MSMSSIALTSPPPPPPNLSNVKILFRLCDDNDRLPIKLRMQLLDGWKNISVVHHRNYSVVRCAARFVYIIFPGKKPEGEDKSIAHVNVTGIPDFDDSVNQSVKLFCSLFEYRSSNVLSLTVNSSTVTTCFPLAKSYALDMRTLSRRLNGQADVIAKINPRFPSRIVARAVFLGRGEDTGSVKKRCLPQTVCCAMFFASGKCNILGLKRQRDVERVARWAVKQVERCANRREI